MVKSLEVTEYRQAVLLVRVHAITITGSPSLVVRAYVTAPTPLDPSADFVHTGFWLASASIVGASAGDLVRAPLGGNVGAHVRVTISATQNASMPETIQARLSAGLLVRR